MIKKSLDRIIRKSLKNIENKYKSLFPTAISSFYYGEYNQNPNLLSIVYIFDNENDYKCVEESFLNEIKVATVNELIKNGYPKDAFEPQNDVSFENDKVNDVTSTLMKQFTDEMNNRCVNIAFVSNERIQKESDGNIFLYFK